MRKIKIYSDGADQASIFEMSANPLISGFTTNPTLMKKAGIKDYRSFGKEVLAKVRDKPISFEVFADDFEEMRRQALDLASWGSNVYVKIPITNSRGASSLELVQELSRSGVKLNVTAILTLAQVYETCIALEGGAPAVVSVFAGRIADTGRDPVPVMRAAREILNAFGTGNELLWASTREVLNVRQAEDAGCQIITVTYDVIKKMVSLENRDLAELSLDTVKMFRDDAISCGFAL